MKVQSNPSFCGKVVPPNPDIINVSHLLTKRVEDAMKTTAEGATLHVEEGRFLDRCKMIFTAPDGKFAIAIKGIKRAMTEKHVLGLIERGRTKPILIG